MSIEINKTAGMTNEFLCEHLGMLVYVMGEINFNAIRADFWEKHINMNEPFTDAQINCFRNAIENLFDDFEYRKI